MDFGAYLRDVLELSRYLENITEPLGRQSDRPWAYHFPGSKWKKESLLCHDCCTAPYRNRQFRPMRGWLGSTFSQLH